MSEIKMLPLPEDAVEWLRQYGVANTAFQMEVIEGWFQAHARAVAEHNVAAREAEWAKLNNLAGYFQDGSAETLRISPDDATRTWHVYRGAQRLGYGSTIHAALVDAMQGASDGQN